jgi:hypothetical protein
MYLNELSSFAKGAWVFYAFFRVMLIIARARKIRFGAQGGRCGSVVAHCGCQGKKKGSIDMRPFAKSNLKNLPENL